MRAAWLFSTILLTTAASARAAPEDADAPTPAAEAAEPTSPTGQAESSDAEDSQHTPPDCPKPENPVVDPEHNAQPDPLEGTRRGAEEDVVPDARGFAMALRVGWGIPQGEQQNGVDVGDRSLGILPVWLDLGYRVTKHVLVGVYAHYAFAFLRDCPADGSCSASDVRFGLQAQWHFGARHAVDHWIGLGAGFEIYDEEVQGITRRYTGFEFANLQFGEDFSLGNRLGLGPFLSLSLGQFTHVEQTAGKRRLSDQEIAPKTLHLWAVIGLRLSFGA